MTYFENWEIYNVGTSLLSLSSLTGWTGSGLQYLTIYNTGSSSVLRTGNNQAPYMERTFVYSGTFSFDWSKDAGCNIQISLNGVSQGYVDGGGLPGDAGSGTYQLAIPSNATVRLQFYSDANDYVWVDNISAIPQPLHPALVHAWSPSISFTEDPALTDLIGNVDLTADVGLSSRVIDTLSKGRYGWDFINNGVGLEAAVSNTLWDGSSAKFSTSFWAKRDITSVSDDYLLCYDNPTQRGWRINLDGAANITFTVRNGGNITTYYTNTFGLMSSTTTWYHVVVTFDASLARASRPKVYVNGSLITLFSINTGSDPTLDTAAASSPLYIGKTPLNFFPNGKVDSVAIYNDILTQQDITDIYNFGREGGLPYLGDNFEPYTAFVGVSTLAGWSAGTGAVRIQSFVGSKKAGYFGTSSGITLWMERIIQQDGTVYFDWLTETNSENFYVYINGILIDTYNNFTPGSVYVNASFQGSASVAVLTGDILRFRLGVFEDSVAVDNISFVHTPAGPSNNIMPILIQQYRWG